MLEQVIKSSALLTELNCNGLYLFPLCNTHWPFTDRIASTSWDHKSAHSNSILVANLWYSVNGQWHKWQNERSKFKWATSGAILLWWWSTWTCSWFMYIEIEVNKKNVPIKNTVMYKKYIQILAHTYHVRHSLCVRYFQICHQSTIVHARCTWHLTLFATFHIKIWVV